MKGGVTDPFKSVPGYTYKFHLDSKTVRAGTTFQGVPIVKKVHGINED